MRMWNFKYWEIVCLKKMFEVERVIYLFNNYKRDFSRVLNFNVERKKWTFMEVVLKKEMTWMYGRTIILYIEIIKKIIRR